jgi:hypothetical protein
VVEIVTEWLVQVVVPGLGAALLVAAIAFVREYAKQMKDERVRKVLEALVQAAEQLYGPGKGEAKRRFVREKMKQNGLGELGREALEAEVYRLKAEG